MAEPIVENLNEAQPIDDNLDDQALLDQEGNFMSGLLEEDLGLLHLFSGLGLDADDDILFDNSLPPLAANNDEEPAQKRKKTVNIFNDHLRAGVRKNGKTVLDMSK